MTLLSMANYICGKVNQTDAEDVTKCKGFLAQFHEMIWNDQLWKDSLVEYSQALDATASAYTLSSTYLPSLGVVLLPAMIQKVLAVRTDARKLNIQRPEYYYRIDYDAFAKAGTPADFICLPPAVWQTNAATSKFYLQRSDAGDAAASVKGDILESDGVTVTRKTAVLAQQHNALINRDTSPTSSGRVDALLKNATTGSVLLRAIGAATITNNSVATTIDVYAHNDGSNLFGLVCRLAPGETGTFTERLPALLLTVFPAGSVSVALGEIPISNGGAWSGTVAYSDGNGLEEMTDTSKTVATLLAGDTAGQKRQRIRLVQIPDSAIALRVLGKRSMPSFTDDLDEPAINGITNCLLAFGQADMLERERQYGKAELKKKEGVMLLQQLQAQEVVQQAHQSQIIPESGYGDDDFGAAALPGFSF